MLKSDFYGRFVFFHSYKDDDPPPEDPPDDPPSGTSSYSGKG